MLYESKPVNICIFFCFILSLLMFSFSWYLLQRLPFYTTAWDVKPLLAFETSWGRSRTKPGTEELWLWQTDRVQQGNTEEQHSPTEPILHVAPTALWKSPLCKTSIITIYAICPNSQKTFNNSRTNRCLDGVCLWGFSVRFQRHSYNHV